MKLKSTILINVANAFEWYNFSLFAILSEIIGKKFFPSEEQTLSILKMFLVFAIGYTVRPIGAILFGTLGDKKGRKNSLSLALICMTIPTIIIGLIPTYETSGIYSSCLLIILRVLQGISLGGILTTAITFSIEQNSFKNSGFIGSPINVEYMYRTNNRIYYFLYMQ